MFGPIKIDNLLEPNLKQFTNFQLAQNKEEKSQFTLIQDILDDNDLEIIPNKSKNSLFAAISMGLFLADDKEDLIMKTISEHLLGLFRSDNIPIRLYSFRDNRKMLTDFLNKPYHEDFQRVYLNFVFLKTYSRMFFKFC